MHADVTPRKRTYIGLFIITLSTLMYEVLLTRIFSVTMWYHFAFMAISIAIFGMSAGAIAVYLFPRLFTSGRAKYHLATSSFLFSLFILLSFLLQMNVPALKHNSMLGFNSLALTYVTTAIPFFYSGICICIALTRFPGHVSKLYAADLLGSAAGCILLIKVLEVTDAPTAVVIVAGLACLGSVFFAAEAGSRVLKYAAALCGIILFVFAGWNSYLVSKEMPVLRLKWVKGVREPAVYLYEHWNSFSRITVSGNPYTFREPFGWGMSPAYASPLRVKELKMEIDGTAGTILTGFNGDVQSLEHLRYDITNIAHYLRPDSDVVVIGVGGGRDVLSALAFNQKSVVGIEMNDAIISAVNERFGDFTGHLDDNPRVTFVADEARSWLARQSRKYEIIQLSLIDTWAATSAGAFVLAENSLYTVEAWRLFLDRLSADGMITVSRWYNRFMPGEVYRLASLAATSLREEGVKHPRKHMVIVRRMAAKSSFGPDGVGTLLLSKRPFTRRDLDNLKLIVDAFGFEMVLSPDFAIDPAFEKILAETDVGDIARDFPLDITPPTDDSPFFFNMLRLHDAFNRSLWEQGNVRFNVEAVFVLVKLLFIVLALTFLFMILPLALRRSKTSLVGSLPLFIYFAGIGFGFMLVEISQMQRLIIFLGHPTYSLSVVLFSLLLSSGIGSYLTSKVESSGMVPAVILAVLLAITAIYGLATPSVIEALSSSSTPVRLCSAVAILFPLGIFLGMAFPVGMKLAATRWRHITPWFWAINGTTSVTASVLSIAISMNWNISAAFWMGFAFYGFSFLSVLWLCRAAMAGWIRKLTSRRSSFAVSEAQAKQMSN